MGFKGEPSFLANASVSGHVGLLNDIITSVELRLGGEQRDESAALKEVVPAFH